MGVVAPSSSDGRTGVGERRVLRVLDRRELMRTRRRVVRVGRHWRGQMLLLGWLVERTLLLMKWVVLHGILQMRRRVQGLVVTHGCLSIQRMMNRQRRIEVIPSYSCEGMRTQVGKGFILCRPRSLGRLLARPNFGRRVVGVDRDVLAVLVLLLSRSNLAGPFCDQTSVPQSTLIVTNVADGSASREQERKTRVMGDEQHCKGPSSPTLPSSTQDSRSTHSWRSGSLP